MGVVKPWRRYYSFRIKQALAEYKSLLSRKPKCFWFFASCLKGTTYTMDKLILEEEKNKEGGIYKNRLWVKNWTKLEDGTKGLIGKIDLGCCCGHLEFERNR